MKSVGLKFTPSATTKKTPLEESVLKHLKDDKNPDDPEFLKKLFEKDKKKAKSILAAKDEEGANVLHICVKRRKAETCKYLLSASVTLIEPDDFINERDAHKWTALHFACTTPDNEEFISTLCKHPKIQVGLQNEDGNTPLHFFCRTYHSPNSEHAFRTLVEKGANVNALSKNQELPLHYAVGYRKTGSAFMTKLLLKHGSLVNHANSAGFTPLHVAAQLGQVSIVRALLQPGRADPTRKSTSGKTALDMAREEGGEEDADLIRILLDAEKKWAKKTALRDWLAGLGLQQYYPKFEKEDFDFDSMTMVKEDDLRAMDIPSGPRLWILNAIEKLKEKIKAPEAKPKGNTSPLIEFKDMALGELLGKGFFAEVRRAIWHGSEVAVKIIYREHFRDKSDYDMFYQETDILCKLRFPYVVQFFGVCIENGRHMMVTEFMKSGNLYTLLHDFPGDILGHYVSQLSIAMDIARGMNYLYSLSPPICHRDLTSKNILLSGKTAKVADFGLSREKAVAAEMTASFGALPWVAPEVFLGGIFTEASDVFSFGVVLWELFSGQDPDSGMAPLLYAKEVAAGYRQNIPASTPEPIKNLIERCWHQETAQRPCFSDIINVLDSLVKANCNDDDDDSSGASSYHAPAKKRSKPDSHVVDPRLGEYDDGGTTTQDDDSSSSDMVSADSSSTNISGGSAPFNAALLEYVDNTQNISSDNLPKKSASINPALLEYLDTTPQVALQRNGAAAKEKSNKVGRSKSHQSGRRDSQATASTSNPALLEYIDNTAPQTQSSTRATNINPALLEYLDTNSPQTTSTIGDLHSEHSQKTSDSNLKQKIQADKKREKSRQTAARVVKHHRNHSTSSKASASDKQTNSLAVNPALLEYIDTTAPAPLGPSQTSSTSLLNGLSSNPKSTDSRSSSDSKSSSDVWKTSNDAELVPVPEQPDTRPNPLRRVSEEIPRAVLDEVHAALASGYSSGSSSPSLSRKNQKWVSRRPSDRKLKDSHVTPEQLRTLHELKSSAASEDFDLTESLKKLQREKPAPIPAIPALGRMSALTTETTTKHEQIGRSQLSNTGSPELSIVIPLPSVQTSISPTSPLSPSSSSSSTTSPANFDQNATTIAITPSSPHPAAAHHHHTSSTSSTGTTSPPGSSISPTSWLHQHAHPASGSSPSLTTPGVHTSPKTVTLQLSQSQQMSTDQKAGSRKKVSANNMINFLTKAGEPIEFNKAGSDSLSASFSSILASSQDSNTSNTPTSVNKTM